jgi:hypothetical protein
LLGDLAHLEGGKGRRPSDRSPSHGRH